MQEKSNILVIEDEPAIRTGLIDVLVFHGYNVDSAEDGNQGLTKALRGEFDLILLDIMLPGVDGLEICRQVRQHDRDQPIIMLTARSSDEDIIEGLTLGADDYVAKPFSVAQLVLRIQAVLRRSGTPPTTNSTIDLGKNTTIDCLNLCGTKPGKKMNFTRREIDVLQYLHQNSDRPVARSELLNKVWGYRKDLEIETRTVDIHIAKLRRKIESDPARPEFLLTIRGAGYRLQSDGSA